MEDLNFHLGHPQMLLEEKGWRWKWKGWWSWRKKWWKVGREEILLKGLMQLLLVLGLVGWLLGLSWLWKVLEFWFWRSMLYLVGVLGFIIGRGILLMLVLLLCLVSVIRLVFFFFFLKKKKTWILYFVKSSMLVKEFDCMPYENNLYAIQDSLWKQFITYMKTVWLYFIFCYRNSL